MCDRNVQGNLLQLTLDVVHLDSIYIFSTIFMFSTSSLKSKCEQSCMIFVGNYFVS